MQQQWTRSLSSSRIARCICRGFDDYGAEAALWGASDTGFTVSGVFRDLADFAVLVLFQKDDPFGHSLFRKKRAVGLSRGDDKITKKQAEVERDKFLAKQNAPTVEAAVEQVAVTGVALISEIARKYEEGYLSREQQISKPTRDKEFYYLESYIIPKWGTFRLNQIRPQAVEDWLHATFNSWWAMHAVRAMMSRLYDYAERHGLWEEGRRSPASKAKLGRKHYTYERRILTFDETARVLARLKQPYRLVVETCIATGARISEVLGLTWKYVDFDSGTIRIEQRVWHQDVGRPKTESSRRTLGLGDLAEQYRERAAFVGARPDDFVFTQKCGSGRPLWDSTVRELLHEAARAPKAATSKASASTPSGVPTSPGGRRSEAARSRHPESLATPTSR